MRGIAYKQAPTAELQALQDKLSVALREVFEVQRKLAQ